MPVPEGKYPPISEAQIKLMRADDLRAELDCLDIQCIRPLLEIYDLEQEGKDSTSEKAILNSRIENIKTKREELRALNAEKNI